MDKDLKIIEGEIVPIYENSKGERLINARELHEVLENRRKFSDWIKQRIEHYKFIKNVDFMSFSQNCEKPIRRKTNSRILSYTRYGKRIMYGRK